MTPPSKPALLQSYRLLYRHGLRALRYSMPARYTLRDRLRRAFRASPPAAYEQRRVDNTILFFRAAAADRGLEHRVLKSLCHVWWLEEQHWRRRDVRLRQVASMKGEDVPVLGAMAVHQAYDQFYFTLRMLNETMGLCLR